MNFKTATSLGLAGASLAFLGSSITANADDIGNDIQPGTNQTQLEQSTQTIQVSQPKQVTVQSGDSLWKISQENNTTVDELIRLNKIQGDGSLIHVGEIIKVSDDETSQDEQSAQDDQDGTFQHEQLAQDDQTKTVQNETSQTDGIQQVNTQSSLQTNASASEIVNYARSFIGVPYVWGGATPSGFDCSGLTQYVFAHFGKQIGRNTVAQENSGQVIAVSQAQPGDLYFWGSRGGTYHVGIATGNGNVIMAPAPGQTVHEQSIQYFYPSFAVRVN